jgi:hypothetical protein
MKKTTKKAATASRAAGKRKVSIKDLAAKNTNSVKGAGGTISQEFDISKRH